jgi:hypothetical protein
MRTKKVENFPGLVRDMSNKAIINTDKDALETYKKKRQQTMSTQEAIDDINNVKNELREIKLMLNQLLQNRS